MTSLLQQAEKKDRYYYQVLNNPPNEKARHLCSYSAWHDQTDASIVEHEFGLHQKGIKVVIMYPSADGGMPHTRPNNLICLPAFAMDNISKLKETIEHELIHIDQRNNSDLWRNRLLEDGWYPDGEVPDRLAYRCRLNPDTLSCRFPAWEGRYIPLPLFVREDKPDLRDILVRWWDMEDERVHLDPPKTYIKRYGVPSASSMEHPFELWAYKHTTK